MNHGDLIQAPVASTRARANADQADGLRRMFAGRRTRVLALVGNPWVPHTGIVLDRLAQVLGAAGQNVLVVDASAGSPAAPELARVDLSACIEALTPQIAYLAAGGLPQDFVDTRGSAGALLEALQQASPTTEVILLHAEATDLVRVLKHHSLRPVLVSDDNPESLKHAYSSCKLLTQRNGLMTYDLVLATEPGAPRRDAIAQSLGSCAEQFLGALVRNLAVVDPGAPASAPEEEAALLRLLGAQLNLDNDASDPLSAQPPWPQQHWRDAGQPWPAASHQLLNPTFPAN